MRFLLIALLLAGCASKPAVPTRSLPAAVPGKIQAGESVDDLKLGESKPDVEKSLGAPEDTDKNEFSKGQTYSLYYSKGLELTFDNDALTMIVCHGPDEKWKPYPGATADGLWIGSTADEIRARLGKAKEEEARSLNYTEQGIWFKLNDQQQVDTISVLPKRESSTGR